MPIERSQTPLGGEQIVTLARQLLDASTLCSIATVSRDGQPHINTAYFAWSNAWEIVWLSESAAQHSQNVRANKLIAIAVYDSHQEWGNSDRGIQLFGRARELSGQAARNAATLYLQRFTRFSHDALSAYRLYRCQPQRMKLFDERALGSATFVTARIKKGGQLTWERTDIYRPTA